MAATEERGKITKSEIVPASGGTPEYCKVLGLIAPAINYEVRLPTAGWNGRFLQQGCSGFCGSPPSNYLTSAADALARGYAVAATDSGHSRPNGGYTDWGCNDPSEPGRDAAENYPNQARIDFAFRAPHLTTIAAKSLIKGFYGRAQDFSYFRGCSQGGRQALIEAQRFPDDYDGIMARDPGNMLTANIGIAHPYWASINWNSQKAEFILNINKISLVDKAVHAKCDGIDGVVDGVIEDPRRCDFDPVSLACPSGADEGTHCLSSSQVAALRKLYDAPRNSAGRAIYPGGLPKGSEANWPGALIGENNTPGRLMSYVTTGGNGMACQFLFQNPGAGYTIDSFNRDTDLEQLKPMSLITNADQTDYTPFKQRGSKLIMFVSAGDAAQIPDEKIWYYNQVAKAMPGDIDSWFRMFMVPGNYHCGNGPGPGSFDQLTAMEKWVESGAPPTRIIASKLNGSVVERTRPLCPYPQLAKYKGSGDTNVADNFVCTQPEQVAPAKEWDSTTDFAWRCNKQPEVLPRWMSPVWNTVNSWTGNFWNQVVNGCR
ncbi:tannase/feruloyl esterase family alpha/beta hydrolase [Variovorax paradoxus]|nr:tannase/feruloyl esterase family alpha/beta hydrolase [Variovorax paradoxus]